MINFVCVLSEPLCRITNSQKSPQKVIVTGETVASLKANIAFFEIVEREVTKFYNNCALPDTSMTLSAFVLQTFLVTKPMLAKVIFSIFKMATMIFKMAVKIIIIKQIKTNVLTKFVLFGSKWVQIPFLCIILKGGCIPACLTAV